LKDPFLPKPAITLFTLGDLPGFSPLFSPFERFIPGFLLPFCSQTPVNPYVTQTFSPKGVKLTKRVDKPQAPERVAWIPYLR